MSREYTLGVFQTIQNWEGNPYKPSERLKLLQELRPGHIVRLMLKGIPEGYSPSLNWWIKVYFEIIEIYQHGPYLIFDGQCIDLYDPLNNGINFGLHYGDKITFYPENILEIPEHNHKIWTIKENSLNSSFNQDSCLEELKIKIKKMSLDEGLKERRKKTDLLDLIKELKKEFKISNKECRKIITCLYSVTNLKGVPSGWKAEHIRDYFNLKFKGTINSFRLF